MQIVIELPKNIYKSIQERNVNLSNFDEICEGILNGTVLPESHGRLIDASKLKVELECGIRAGNYEEGYEKYAHINNMDDCVDAVEYADTIIEADKTEGNE